MKVRGTLEKPGAEEIPTCRDGRKTSLDFSRRPSCLALLCSFISPLDALLRGLTKGFRMQVRAAFFGWFHFFHGDAVMLCIGIVADAGQLPGNFHSWLAPRNFEAIPTHLPRNIDGRKSAD